VEGSDTMYGDEEARWVEMQGGKVREVEHDALK